MTCPSQKVSDFSTGPPARALKRIQASVTWASEAPASPMTEIDFHQLREDIRLWGRELGFQQVGISDVDLSEHEAYLQRWLDKGYHGEMDYMARHGTKRSRPAELVPGTLRVISLRMDYLPS